MSQYTTPIIFMVFNRPDHTSQVFELIEAMRPQKLLVIADGPRQGRPQEAQACAKVRSIATNVSWPCEVITNFADENMGCGRRIASGLNWAFDLVEEAVILEDDCLPDPTFFQFAAEMLEMYRNDERVAAITGTNIVEDSLHWPYSYYFSRIV